MDALTILERKRLRVGDRIPGWNFPLCLTRDLQVDEFVAKPVVIIFLGEPNSPYAQNIFVRFRDLHVDFLKTNANVIGIFRAEISDLRRIAQEYALPFPLAADPTGRIAEAYGINGQGTVIFDANQRIVQILHRISDHDARNALELIRSMTPIWSSRHPPVLLLSDVIDRELALEVIDFWESESRNDPERMMELIDHGRKIRSDRFLKAGKMRECVNKILDSRVRPEIQKAFQFDAQFFENCRVACYDSTSTGYLRPHRDNTTQDTRHRRFTISLNLNSEDYEGGLIHFPEYGSHQFKTETGGAVIFSCSLLHNASTVVRGRRFVLLTFLYGAEEAHMRESANPPAN